jgi:hypothetical protein
MRSVAGDGSGEVGGRRSEAGGGVAASGRVDGAVMRCG